MAYTIISESYGPRKPFITATADSTDDLATLGTDFAEGSTCVISTTTYKLDKVKGWIDPSQGGGGGGGGGGGAAWLECAVITHDDGGGHYYYTLDKTAGEIVEALPYVLLVNDAMEDNNVISYSYITLYEHYDASGDDPESFEFDTSDSLSFFASGSDDYPSTQS